MLVAEPTPMPTHVVFGEKYSVLGKSKRRFMPGRFSTTSRKHNLQLAVNLAWIVLLEIYGSICLIVAY